jgi:flavin-dependent dehydrogenase
MVSPLTAGGIHAALKYGLAAGHAVTDFLQGRREDPCGWFVDTYPRYRTKRLLRLLFDHLHSDTAFNLLLASPPLRMAASIIYFHRKGVFHTPGNRGATGARPAAAQALEPAAADQRPEDHPAAADCASARWPAA